MMLAALISPSLISWEISIPDSVSIRADWERSSESDQIENAGRPSPNSGRIAICAAPHCLNPRSRLPDPSFFELRAGIGKVFCAGLVTIAYYALIDKGIKTIQVFGSQGYIL
jgi:hypothetical protein